MSGEWETVIGLEIHAQLSTQSKIFSGSAIAYGAPPNAQANLVDLGYPGVLPVLNAEAVRMAVKFGLGPAALYAAQPYDITSFHLNDQLAYPGLAAIAAVLYGSEDLRVEQIDVPALAADEVLIRVRLALTDGTDLKVWKRGYHAKMIQTPAVFGHEVEAVMEGELQPYSRVRRALLETPLWTNQNVDARRSHSAMFHRPIRPAAHVQAATPGSLCRLPHHVSRARRRTGEVRPRRCRGRMARGRTTMPAALATRRGRRRCRWHRRPPPAPRPRQK